MPTRAREKGMRVGTGTRDVGGHGRMVPQNLQAIENVYPKISEI